LWHFATADILTADRRCGPAASQDGTIKRGLQRSRRSAIIMPSRLPALILIAAPFSSRLSRYKSSTIANRPRASMHLSAKRASSAGPRIAFSSSTRTSAYPAPVRLHDPALRVSPLRLRSPALVSCSVWRCRGLARNNADWHRLIDLAGLTDTLIGDADGIYHPALFNDRLLLGLKGTMSEAELHVLRARLNGGIRNKAARGELRRGLPVGFVWGEADGEVLLHPDEAVVTAICTIFARFAETGSARRVWLWLRDQGPQLPLQTSAHAEIRWVEASYHAIHQVLSNPVYAGAYVYGKTRTEMTLEPSGSRRKRIRHPPRDQWQVLIKEHHRGYIDWQTYDNEANQTSHGSARPMCQKSLQADCQRRCSSRT
jgi:Recombinase